MPSSPHRTVPPLSGQRTSMDGGMERCVVGVDCHADTLTAVRVDAVGRAPGVAKGAQHAGRARAIAAVLAGAGRTGLGGGRRWWPQAGEGVHEIPG